MSSQEQLSSQASIDPALLDGDIIIVDVSTENATPVPAPPTSSAPISASPIDTVPRRRFAWVWKHMPDSNPQTIYKDIKGMVRDVL
jgi:hypothetical protein